jgi:chromosomal replication initiation ATPase DnaA
MVLRETEKGFTPSPPSGASLCRVAEYLVAAAYETDVAAIRSMSRGPARAAYARQAAMYLLRVGLGLPNSEIGAYFQRDRTTVAHACARIEDSRDDANLDQTLECLEAALHAWRGGLARAGSRR